MAVTIEEFRDRVRAVKHPTEEYTVDEGFTLVIGGVPSFGAMQGRSVEAGEVEKSLAAFPLKDGDGNEVPVGEEAMQSAVVVACGVREPALTIRDALELSVSHPFEYGEIWQKVLAMTSRVVREEVSAATKRLAADPTTPPSSE